MTIKSKLTVYDIASSIRLARSQYKGSFLLLEGNEDLKVYRNFIDISNCRIIPVEGKYRSLEVVSMLDNEKFEGILAIVDRDSWYLDKYKPKSKNILVTDTHDLETMILSSNCFDKVLEEYVSVAKVDECKKNLRDQLHQLCLPIGYLRWISSKRKLNLKFTDLRYKRFIDRKTLDIDISALIKTVKNNSQNHQLDEDPIEQEILELIKAGKHDPWQVCHGEDMMHMLLIGMHNTFGNKKSKKLTPELLHSATKISYDYERFKLTKLYKSIKKWEKANRSFKIL